MKKALITGITGQDGSYLAEFYNEGDPNYDLFRHALRCSAKRLFPNFSFLDAPFNLQYYKPGDYNTCLLYTSDLRVMVTHSTGGELYAVANEVVLGCQNVERFNLAALGLKQRFHTAGGH